ncbi:class I SAM-dependent methyltransferase [Allopusillimonas ginsengisoli]|uniref:class I SAM-dependent methyltransferase n=1 Tax=Allopusillimonas ginsengisoli TaxID=453575 RepID=UPI001021B043|nr:class I SAM-dependent methyltransferase [Allopusillimonas ginsengisoli]TEA74220.1 class I SAM-dependent methyltransferase [Allopusillimonas ginsengisoli]
MTIESFDFAESYRERYRQSTRRPKTPQDWDARARKMSRDCVGPDSPYVQAFISHMDLRGVESLLDVGCGTGAICLPVARRLKQVYALDFSPGMLEVLKISIRTLVMNNVRCIERAWDDEWDDVPACDIVVASRSMALADLDKGLRKLSAKAKKRVYTTHMVSDHFVSDEAFHQIGRKSPVFPDYIYALNLLYQQGYRASVDFIKPPVSHVGADQLEENEFIEAVRWSAGELSREDKKKLKAYYRKNAPQGLIGMPQDKTWAFISWETC